MSLRKQFLLLAVLTASSASCHDAVGPGCGRCLPVTGLVVQGEVLRVNAPTPSAIVRMRLLDAEDLPRDSIAGCIGTVIRDTTLATSDAGRFQALLIAGFPVFDVCLEVQGTPIVAGAFTPIAVGYPHLELRDTSLHDALNITLRIR